MAAAWFNKLCRPCESTRHIGRHPTRRACSPAQPGTGHARRRDRPDRRQAAVPFGGSGAPSNVLLVTMGCGDACPYVPGLKLYWPLPDPKGESIESVRAIRTRFTGG